MRLSIRVTSRSIRLARCAFARRRGSAMHGAEAGKPLIKVSHCEKCIYSFGVPRRCPLCLQDVGSRKLEEAPVSISNPFADGHREKCSFLLRPTRGSFLREYDGRSDLHVGVTNTNGVVYNYSMHGVQRDEAGWEQSLAVPLLQPNMFGLMDQWDKYLEDFSTSGAWLPHRYYRDSPQPHSLAIAGHSPNRDTRASNTTETEAGPLWVPCRGVSIISVVK